MQLSKTYETKKTESTLYQEWMEKGYFKCEPDFSKKPFTIVMPPPNITGQLHMGHALDNMMQDAIIRFKRMQGYAALWLPGTDHASIATEVKIVDQLRQEGIIKESLGRDEFLKRAWAWKEKFGGRIVEQLKKLGSSCDWSRERFTMDEGLSRAVRTAFVRLYEKGLIYRGNRIINWCPSCKTALSDAEVEYEEQDSYLWYIRYPAPNNGEGVIVATTRPETMLGDTAVAVNPNDKRFSSLIGKSVILPIMEREIPVVADDYVDMEFGTGAVKITPAHDPNDFEVAARHNLPIIRILTDDGYVNDEGGKYAGIYKDDARKQIVEELKGKGLLVDIKPLKHNVGQCYRCHETVEPIISRQWFLSMKELAKPAIAAVEKGDISFIPERFNKIYFNWMNNIRDWCISRQLWWGHRIPAYYCEDCKETIVSLDEVTKCTKCGSKNIKQDEDVLDTWFSSGLWPFSTLGWPDDTLDLKFFYPTNVLVTGYDIIFFWVARMIMFGLECMGEIPFDKVCVHGIIRDSQGRKMSKSLNNGIDPLEIIDKYGADALRFSLAIGVSQGNDMRFYYEKVEAARNFGNKIWNASRFVLMNTNGEMFDEEGIELADADKWILSRLNSVITEVTDHMESFELGLAAQKIYDFLWSEFCDWYIELSKPRLLGDEPTSKKTACYTLTKVLLNTLKLLHPFMPFLTEQIFMAFKTGEKSIMISDWPKVKGYGDIGAAADRMEQLIKLIRSIRNARAELNVPPAKKTRVFVFSKGGKFSEEFGLYLNRLAFASDVEYIDKPLNSKDMLSITEELAQVFIPLGELVDIEKEIARMTEEREHIKDEIKRAKSKLENPGFVNKAPKNVVDAEKEKLSSYIELEQQLSQRLKDAKKL
ncbi:MAG: valine--tRNA ligase [Eubacteriales bacterium]